MKRIFAPFAVCHILLAGIVSPLIPPTIFSFPQDKQIIIPKDKAQRENKWKFFETRNAKVFYNKNNIDLAIQVANQVEKFRLKCAKEFECRHIVDWTPKVEVYLYSPSEEYNRALPSRFEYAAFSNLLKSSEGETIVREIRVDINNPQFKNLEDILTAISYETHHVFFFDLCEKEPLIWASEGCAFLNVDLSLKKDYEDFFLEMAEAKKLFPLKRFINSDLDEYRTDEEKLLYLAESFAFVDFLAGPKGLGTLAKYAKFINDGLKNGYEASLKRNYRIKDYEELQKKFNQWIKKKIKQKD